MAVLDNSKLKFVKKDQFHGLFLAIFGEDMVGFGLAEPDGPETARSVA